MLFCFLVSQSYSMYSSKSILTLIREKILVYLKQQVETMANAGVEQGEEAKKMMEDDEDSE